MMIFVLTHKKVKEKYNKYHIIVFCSIRIQSQKILLM